MASPSYSILYSAKVSGSAVSGGMGNVLIPDTSTGLYILATAAARGTRRSTGIALGPYTPNSAVEIQQSGQVDATTAGLGAGAASWVRVSTAGGLERCTPTTGDDVIGWVETDGTLHLACGFLTAAMATGGGGSTPSGTGIPHIVLGVMQPAASPIVDSDIVGPVAGTKVTPAFGSQNVSTTGNVSIGTNPAATGAIALANNTSITFRDSSNSADIQAVRVTSAEQSFFGNPSNSLATSIQCKSTGLIYLSVGGSVDAASFAVDVSKYSVPIIGSSSASSPYGVHGGVSHTFAADANYTVTAAQYCYDRIRFITGAITAGRTVTFPAPASEAVGYYKTIYNGTSFTLTISTGAGTTKTLATAQQCRFWFDNSGVTYAGVPGAV